MEEYREDLELPVVRLQLCFCSVLYLYNVCGTILEYFSFGEVLVYAVDTDLRRWSR
jgi:hypothetical protein